jgi:hypothetical protein
MVECIQALRGELVQQFVDVESFDQLKGEVKSVNDLVTKKIDSKITEVEDSINAIKTEVEEKT